MKYHILGCIKGNSLESQKHTIFHILYKFLNVKVICHAHYVLNLKFHILLPILHIHLATFLSSNPSSFFLVKKKVGMGKRVRPNMLTRLT